jgi:hypothetical protein
MELDGYLYRLSSCFFNAPLHYAARPDLSPESAAAIKAGLLLQGLGPGWGRRPGVRPEEMPQAYHTYKGKCLLEGMSGLACERAHAHEREIVSNWREPAKAHMAQAARALRLAKMLANEPGWTLWNMSKLPEVLHTRLAHLRVVPAFEKVCPCGRHKPNVLV